MATSVYTLNVNVEDGTEQDRLDQQHRCILLLTRHDKLLPEHVHNFLLSVEHTPAVADMATGTGIWLKALAAELPPQARLDGYDFDVAKLPDTSTLPPNVKLSIRDCLAPFPAELHAQYDCVHIRMITGALRANQWRELVANVKPLLRRGGWLVWEDPSFPGIGCLPMTENFQKWINIDVRFATSVGRDVCMPLRLLEVFKDQGYVNCTEQTFSSFGKPDEVQDMAGEVTVSFASQSMHGIVDRGGLDWLKTHEQVDDMVGALRGDLANGCKIGFQIHQVTGQNL